MLWLLSGRDFADALNKRMAARPAHIALSEKLRKDGKLLFGGALLGDAGNMIGSMLICDFSSRQELDEWLEVEPYITGGVWENVRVEPFQVGPSFQDMLQPQ